MKQNGKEPWYTSVVAIVIAMICFWPVGCVFLYLRLSKSRNKYNIINMILLISTICLLFVGIVGMSVYFEEHEISNLWIALLMFIIPGMVCGYFWYKRRKKFKEYKKYLDYINARKKVKLDSLCNRLNVNYDTAVSNLTEIINNGFIDGYLTEDELVIKGIFEEEFNKMENNTQPASRETKIVKCRECGAKNTIVVGQPKECEYCGTILQ